MNRLSNIYRDYSQDERKKIVKFFNDANHSLTYSTRVGVCRDGTFFLKGRARTRGGDDTASTRGGDDARALERVNRDNRAARRRDERLRILGNNDVPEVVVSEVAGPEVEVVVPEVAGPEVEVVVPEVEEVVHEVLHGQDLGFFDDNEVHFGEDNDGVVVIDDVGVHIDDVPKVDDFEDFDKGDLVIDDVGAHIDDVPKVDDFDEGVAIDDIQQNIDDAVSH